MSGSEPTLEQLAAALDAGEVTARALVETCLANIAAPDGEGARTFISVDAEGARAAAERSDALRAWGQAPSRFAGIPISVKDLFDVAGQRTRAGSRVLDDAPPAAADAPAIARLRRAGFVLLGRTNMTEFAFSGLGLNPHFGTPRNRWRRGESAISGGSSSGAAISVSDGMAHAGIGTDTGGSCRIPAAFNGLAGWKPTARRIPREGAIPLSTTLDTVGPIARSVACCAALDAIVSGEVVTAPLEPALLSGRRFAAPRTLVLEGMDASVAGAFARALRRLEGCGARVENIDFPEFAELPSINAKGGFAAYEAYAWHRDLIAAKAALYDPRVLVRIRRGAEQSEADYAALKAARGEWIARVTARIADYDALLMPTTPIAPPLLADLADDAEYGRINLLVLRNPSVINFLDGCALSTPMHEPGQAPAGLTVAGVGGTDHAILAFGAAIERALV